MAENGTQVATPADPTIKQDALPEPKTTLELYSRIYPGIKFLFIEPGSDRARYFLVNRIPHRHSDKWRPVFWRGDNPKYSPGSLAIGRALRGAFFSSFRLYLGEGVHEVLDNMRRRQVARGIKFKSKWKFNLGGKNAKGPLEEEQEIQGKVILVRMKRVGLSRSVEFELDGVVYRWSGTRKFGKVGAIKGWSHSLKLIRKSDHALVATFEKGRWSSYCRSVKTDGPPNKKKYLVGKLRIYDTVPAAPASCDVPAPSTKMQKDGEEVNPDGFHHGDILEEAIVFSCWAVVEAEHRLRYKVLDILSEIGETIGG